MPSTAVIGKPFARCWSVIPGKANTILISLRLPAPRWLEAKAGGKPPNKNTKPCCNVIPISHADGLITHVCFLKAV